MTKHRPFAFFILLLLAGCEKNAEMPDGKDVAIATFGEMFDRFWSEMNRNYAYWDMEDTDWDGVYTAFAPRFAKLDLGDPADRQKSVSLFREIVSGLRDSHLSIGFLDSDLRDSAIYPAGDRRKDGYARDFHHLHNRYFHADLTEGRFLFVENDGDKLLFSRFGRTESGILYFGLNAFHVARALRAGHGPTMDVMDSLDFYLGNAELSKGLIVDLRGNRGGDLADLNLLFGKLALVPAHIGFLRYKNGDGRLDHTPWIKTTLYPNGQNTYYGPIVVLVDSRTASAAEIFAMAVRCLPNGRVVGERTWGATAFLSPGIAFGYGGFQIGGFMDVKLSGGQFKCIDGQVYEGIGFPPDVASAFDASLYQTGIDNQLEDAIVFLMKN